MQFDDDGMLLRLAADLTGAGVAASAKASVFVDKVAGDIEATAKQLVPVDTGATKNSIGSDPAVADSSGISVEIGPTTHYAPYLEYGSSQQAPNGFMGPAADMHVATFVAGIEALGGEVL